MITTEIFRITGISPLLMNNPAKMRGHTDEITTGKNIPAPDVEAEAGCYRNDDGTLYLPAIMFRSSLIKGCTGRRLGKLSASTVVAAGVFNANTACQLFNPETGTAITTYKINAMRAVIQKAGVIRCRPEIWPWALDLLLEVDDAFITSAHVTELLNYAGRIAGVADFRPQKKGPYGRYSAEHRSTVDIPQTSLLAAE